MQGGLIRRLQRSNDPRQVTVTGQMLIRKPALLWPVTVTLDRYFSENAYYDNRTCHSEEQ